MSNSKESIFQQAYNFEEICSKVLLNKGIKLGQEVSAQKRECDFDIVCYQEDKISLLIEVKFYRNGLNFGLLTNSVYQVKNLAANCSIEANIAIIVNKVISNEFKEKFEQTHQVILIGLEELLALAADSPELLDSILKVTEQPIPQITVKSEDVMHRLFGSEFKTMNKTVPKLSKTDKFIKKLQKLEVGNGQRHEKLMTDILKYLFDDVMNGWHLQKTTTDGRNRFDLICRIFGRGDLWDFLSKELTSKYIMFEFKNYADPISQSQIFTTERYLFLKAKRTVCFIISRVKESKSALAARQGALREHGKLIIHLRDKDIFKMLEMKEEGNDPADYLFEVIDNFLLRLPR